MKTPARGQTRKPHRVVFLFDVDNTLLNNDRVTQDLQQHLEKEVGPAGANHYWAIFDELRTELGYADYLGALQRFRNAYPHDLRLLTVSHFLINYPFATRLYPDSLDVLEKAKGWGPVALLTDGDVVFQPRKVDRSGLLQAVNGQVLCYVHKELELADVARRYPARHYVVIDDKLRLLTAIKKVLALAGHDYFCPAGPLRAGPKNHRQLSAGGFDFGTDWEFSGT